MKYQAKPVIVDAFGIARVEEMPAADPPLARQFWLEDGRERTATPGMLARYIPVPGDYYVVQEDGYQYLNPKDVFERKYELVPEVKAVEVKRVPTTCTAGVGDDDCG